MQFIEIDRALGFAGGTAYFHCLAEVCAIGSLAREHDGITIEACIGDIRTLGTSGTIDLLGGKLHWSERFVWPSIPGKGVV